MVTRTKNDFDFLALENQFCFALYSTSLALTKSYKPLLDKIGLTYPQYLVMLVLWQQDNILVKDIGELLFLDSGTLTPLLKRMELAELIQRQRDPDDERQVRILLTRQGKLLRNAAKEIPEKILCASGQQAGSLHKMRQELVELRAQLQKFNQE